MLAKLRIFNGISVTIWLQKYFAVVDAEDTAVAYLAALPGGKDFDIAPTTVKIVAERYTILEVEYRAVRFPNGNIDRVAAVEHSASGGYVYRASHQENVGLNFSLNIPGDCGAAIFGRFSANRQVNLTELSFSSESESSDVKSVMRIGISASKSLS